MERELVVIVERADSSGWRCRRCDHPVEVDPETWAAIFHRGASPLCKTCAGPLFAEFPDAIDRA